jgi:hypothetical protein
MTAIKNGVRKLGLTFYDLTVVDNSCPDINEQTRRIRR